MSLFLSEVPERPIRRGPRKVPIVASAAVHGLFFVWLFASPLPKRQNSYDMMIRPRETHLVWYSFKRKLPDVSPRSAKAEKRPLRADVLEKQSIVSSAKARDATQMIFHPVPVIKPQPVTPLPNLIALSAPPPKQFVAPQPRPAVPAARVVDTPPAPELRAKVTAPNLPALPKVAKPFTPPAEREFELTTHVQVTDAPSVEPAKSALAAPAAKTLDQAGRMLAFRPEAKRSVTAGPGALADAPTIQPANSSQANIAVVGLNAVDSLKVALPEGSRAARFAAGPKLNPDGASSSGKSSGLTVPDLTVRGGDKDAAANLIARTMTPAYNSPTSAESLRAAARSSVHPPEPEDIGHASGTRVSGAPDPRFLGRQVFSVAIQSPNLSSHQGSWLMWYADRSARPYHETLTAPQPLHKVDPRYVVTAAEEHVEGTVRLAFVIAHDGHVYGVETVKGIDDRLDQSAVQALQKWTFEPAQRNGQAIDVDALVEIPFRLAPPEPK